MKDIRNMKFGERMQLAMEYKELGLDTPITVDEAKAMYRDITGACKKGTEEFIARLGTLKEKYTVREILELTKDEKTGELFFDFFRGVK